METRKDYILEEEKEGEDEWIHSPPPSPPLPEGN